MALIQAVRGMNDILPDATPQWQQLETAIRALMTRYAYQEIRFPIVENTELFKRSVGEVTDIVEKEMYTFADRNGDSLSLRPEGTAVCVRTGIEHGLFYNQLQRLWYMGPMFRHERPQKGRYRQFQQLGVEAFGMSDPSIDAELICLSARLWQELGITDLELQLNSLGSNEARAHYKQELIRYFSAYQTRLDEDSQRRLQTNPLRILDSKNPAMAELNANAPKLLDYLDEISKQHFATLCSLLDSANIRYAINPRLVRGLDYYNGTVFEWVSNNLGAQGTVCAGGRYDSLVGQLGGKATPAIGFAMGLERILSLLTPINSVVTDVYLIALGTKAQAALLLLAEKLRQALPTLKVLLDCSGASMKSQLKRANQSGARLALILGETELEQQQIVVKYLREERAQEVIAQNSLFERLSASMLHNVMSS